MKNDEKPNLGGTGKGVKAKQDRAERSAKALRDNLRRRKTQARGRDLGDGGSSGAVGDSAAASKNNSE